MKWDSHLYDEKHNFVSAYGGELIEWIPKKEELSVLDLGCGTGVLTARLSSVYHRVLGIDSSADMIKRAKANYPDTDFIICDALNIPFKNDWDVVFSNAVFHWINDHDRLLHSIHNTLKPQGVLICEFGAHDNINQIETAFKNALNEYGYSYKPKFNFPISDEFENLLNKNGFIIDYISVYDRPTPLSSGKDGLKNWIEQFFASELEAVSQADKLKIYESVEKHTAKNLWNGKNWVADYKRLRAVAHIH